MLTKSCLRGQMHR